MVYVGHERVWADLADRTSRLVSVKQHAFMITEEGILVMPFLESHAICTKSEFHSLLSRVILFSCLNWYNSQR